MKKQRCESIRRYEHFYGIRIVFFTFLYHIPTLLKRITEKRERHAHSLTTSGIKTGYRSIQSDHGPSVGVLIVRLDFHTAELHLNPLPNAICQTLSPLFIFPLASMQLSSYHNEDEDVLPNLCNVILEASTCSADSCRFFCSSSITALPPAWMQKCSKAILKSGMYGFHFALQILRPMRDVRKSSCSDAGRTKGPIHPVLVLIQEEEKHDHSDIKSLTLRQIIIQQFKIYDIN